MADVSVRLFDGDERGQLMIVLSLAIALMFVSMALYLNTAIFTENLATRKGDIAGTAGAESFKSSAADATEGIVHSVNRRNNSTVYTDLDDAYRTNVRNWSDAAGRLAAARSRAAAVTVEGTTDGSRIVQVQDRNFTNASGTKKWQLASGVGVRDHRLNISQGSLETSNENVLDLLSNDVFRMEFTDGTISYYVYVYEGSNDFTVTVENETAGSTVGTCGIDGSRAVLDVTGATLAGEPCPALSFFDNFSTTNPTNIDVAYNNSEKVEGTYNLVVDEDRSTFSSDDDYASHGSTDGPFVTTAIYATEVRVVYQTPRIEYATVLRVAPGEPDG